MTRIYTRSGDQGQTSLGDGSRTDKCSPRIELYGDIDELNSILGCSLAALDGGGHPTLVTLRAAVRDIQAQLFQVGTVVADPGRCRTMAADKGHPFPVRSIEVLIDSLTKDLEPLQSFILPGGTPAAGFLHLARTVCRRAERRAVALARGDTVPAAAIMYLNRLSDFLFTAARAANAAAGVQDVLWRPSGQDR